MNTRESPSCRPSACTRATTMVWSPPSCSASIVQSIQPMASESTGAPLGAVHVSTPSKRSMFRAAKARESFSCGAPRMLIARRPAGRIRGQVDDDRAGQNATSGGSSETEVNELQAIPCRSPSWSVVTMTTPVG
jgi:hypothetical protein